MSIVANNRFLQRVNPEIKRALADSGSSLNHPEIQQLMRQMVDLGIADNLKLWVHSGLVKTRTSGSDLYVPKAYDISGEENDAAQTTEANQPELVGNGFYYNGDLDKKLISNGWFSLLNIPSGTVMLWFRCTSIDLSLGSYLFILRSDATNDMVGLRVLDNASGNVLRGFYGDSWVNLRPSPAIVPNTNLFYHVVILWESDDAYMYVDGAVVADASSASPSGSPTELTGTIGNATVIERHHEGYINDFRVFNKALSSTQISAIYNQTKSKYGHT